MTTSWKLLPFFQRRLALGWALALLLAWVFTFVVAKPAAAQSEITPSSPCFVSRNLTNLTSGDVRGITNQPVISGNGSREAFWSVNNLGGGNVDGNIEIFVRETNSNSIVQLTNSVGSILGGFNLEPSINANGTVIAFYSDRDLVEGENTDGNFEIFLGRRASNGTWSITQVTNTQGSANLFPSINAAGNRIAFVSDDSELHNIDQSLVNADRNFEIYLATIPANGAVQFRQITNTGAGVTNDQPVINATGNRIAFTAATGQTSQVFVWDESHATPAQLTQTDSNDQPSISADGTSIVYIATNSDDRSRIVLHTLSADGSESRAEVIVPATTSTKYRSPAISGNGQRVAYVSEQGSGAALQINVLLYDVNTGLAVPISEVGGGTGEQPAISTDGTRVTFVGVKAVGGTTDSTGSDIYLNDCPQADLALEFVTDPVPSVLAGIDVTYQFRVTNHGPSIATDSYFRSDLGALPGLPVNVDRKLPQGCSIDASDILVCPLGDLAVDASKVFTFGYDIPSNAGLSDIVSQIEVGANIVDSKPENNTKGPFKTRVFEEAAVSLKVTTDQSSILAGSPTPLVYNLEVTSLGPSQARSTRITNTLSSEVTFGSVQLVSGGGAGASCAPAVGSVVTCQLGNLTAGSTTLIQIRVFAKASAIGPLINTATVRSSTEESNTANNTVVTQTPVDRAADMVITKVATPTVVIAGRLITYTLTFTNNGFSDTANPMVIDTLPQSVTFVSGIMPPNSACVPGGGGQIVTCNFPNSPGNFLVGDNRTFSIVALVDSSVPAGTITNTARIFSDRTDPAPINDVTPPVTATVALLSDLVVSKTVNNATPDILQLITYTVKLRNNGPSQAYSVVVTDLLPSEMTFVNYTSSIGSYDDGSGVWTVGTLPVRPIGQEESLVVTAFATAGAGGDTKVNTATAFAPQPEPVPDLPSSASATVKPQRADVQVGITSAPAIATHVIAGKRLTYTLTITNAGPNLARSVLLTDVLPANVFLVSTTPHSGRPACTNGSTITCAVGDITANQVLKYTVVVTRALKGLITDTVKVSSLTPDVVLGNNSASHTIQVDPDLPNRLVFTQQPPAATTVGVTFAPSPKIELRDRFNNLIVNTTGSSDTIRLTPFLNNNSGVCQNQADLTALHNGQVSASAGVAVFASMDYTRSQTIFLKAEDITPGRSVTDGCSTAIILNADTVTELRFTTPERSFIAGDVSDVMTVERLDQFGNQNLDGDFLVQLTEDSPGTGTFISGGAPNSPAISSIVISDATATASFYFTDTLKGTHVITASGPISSAVAPAVQNVNVLAAPAQELLVIISAPLTTTAGITSSLFTVQRTDRFNNPNTTDPDVTVDLSTDSVSGNGVFIDAGQIVTQVTIPLGSSTSQFSYKDTLAAVHTLTVSDDAHILHGDNVNITVVPATTYQFVITSTTQVITAGTVSGPIHVVREDFFGNHNFTDPAQVVQLSTSSASGHSEFRASPAGGSVSSVTIPQGSDSTDFYYKDELAKVFNLTASAGGIQSAVQAITVVADVPQHLDIITTTTEITAGAPPFTITIQRQDQFNNPATAGAPLTIFLQKQSPQGKFMPIGSTTVITKVVITASDATFRYQDFQQGNWQLTYTDNLPTNFDTFQDIVVNAAIPAKLVYLQHPASVVAGQRSGLFEVQRQDQFNNPYTGPTPLTVYLTSDSPGIHMFINGFDGTSVITTAVIAGGESSVTFYYNDSASGSHTIRSDDHGSLTDALTSITVGPDGAFKLKFINTTITTTAGITSTALIVQVQDQFSNPVTPTIGSPVVVNLSTTAAQPPARYVHPTTNTVITQISIGGSSTASFRYYDEKAASPVITADDVGTLLTDANTVNIVPATANHIIFLTSPITLTAGVTSTQITIQRLDQFNNPNFKDAARTIQLAENSGGTTRFINATSNAVLPSSQLVIPLNSDRASFRYFDTKRGSVTITATPQGSPVIAPITQIETVFGAAPVVLKITGSSTQTAGQAQQLTITALDAFQNQSDPYTGTKTLTFGGAGQAPNGNAPTVTNAGASPVAFGTGTALTFQSGVRTVGGSMALYDANPSVTITANDSATGISATGSNALVLTVAAANLSKIQAETTTGGAEVAVIVPTQTVAAGSQVVLFAVGRDSFGNTRGNIPAATWVMTKTGGVVNGDLATSGAQATFTGHLSGTAIIEPRTAGAISVPSGKLTVGPAADAIVRVETKADGTGQVVPAQALNAGASITVYAIVRDSLGNFKGNQVATWSVVTTTGGVNIPNNTNLSVTSGQSTVFTAKQIGSGRIRAQIGSLSRQESGVITVNPGSADHFSVSKSGAADMGVNDLRTFSITALDAFSNTATSYTGAKTLTFTGAQSSTAPVTAPYVVNSSSTQKIFGQATALNFSAGVLSTASNAGQFKLFNAPYPATPVVIVVADGAVTGSMSVNVSPNAMDRIGISAPVYSLVAGTPVSLTLTAEDDFGNRISSYTGSKTLVFAGSPDPTVGANSATVTRSFPPGGPVNFGSNTPIDFVNGQATTSSGNNGVMRLFKAGAFTISVKQSNNQFDSGTDGSKNFTVSINQSQVLAMTLASPQTNRTAFVGTNTLSLTDIYGNPLAARPVTITTSLTGTIIIAGSGNDNVLSNELATTGSVDLSAGGLAMRYEGVANKTGTFTATTTNPLGGFLTATSSVLVNHATPSRIQIRGSTNTDALASTLTITAGQPVSLSMRLFDQDGNLGTGVSAARSLIFTLTPNPNPAGTVTNNSNGSVTINGSTAANITFAAGVSSVAGNGSNGKLILQKSGTYTLTAATSGLTMTTPSNFALKIIVQPAGANAIAVRLANGQINNTTFTGTNVLTATDSFGNFATSFGGAGEVVTVTVSNQPTGTVIFPASVGGSNVLHAADFVNGIANLTALGMKYTGLVSPIPNFVFTLQRANKTTTTASAAPTMSAGSFNNFVMITAGSTLVAGNSLSTTLRTYDLSSNLINFTGSQVITFTGASAATDGTTPKVNQGSDVAFDTSATINFTAGVANVNLKLYKVETANIFVKRLGVQVSNVKSVTVSPATVNAVSLSGPSSIGAGVPTSYTVSATDAYSNAIANGLQTVQLHGASAATDGTVPKVNGTTNFNTNLSLNFVSGSVGVTLFLPKSGATTLTAQVGAVTSSGLVVTVTPGVLAQLILNGLTPVVAGASIPITLTANDVYSNAIVNGGQTVTFSGASAAPDGTAPTVNGSPFGTGISLTFTNGQATATAVLPKSGATTISAQSGAVTSNNKVITVSTSATVAFAVNIRATQQLTLTFSSPAVITATDTFSNVVTAFNASVNNVTASIIVQPPSCPTTPVIAGLGTGNNAVLNRATDFVNGVANLIGGTPANAMKVNSGCAGTYRFRFTSGAATGDSGNITFTP